MDLYHTSEVHQQQQQQQQHHQEEEVATASTTNTTVQRYRLTMKPTSRSKRRRMFGNSSTSFVPITNDQDQNQYHVEEFPSSSSSRYQVYPTPGPHKCILPEL
jgi:hypothetical protein